MDILNDKINKLYFKYLYSCLGSSLISCIYAFVDTIAIGQYEGPNGTAAITTINPIFTIIFSMGMLFGIGGSVLMSTARGAGNKKDGDIYFTTAAISVTVVAVVIWLSIIIFARPMLIFFGADDTLANLGMLYIKPLSFVLPLFTLSGFFGAFVRNDNNPLLGSIAVISGGVFNIFGDIFFVFTCDMGIFGAGLATALGQAISTVILLTHFFSKKRQLKFVHPEQFFKRLKKIIATGFSTFSIDIAMGILCVMFNRQIMLYFGPAALSVYGAACMMTTFLQCITYGVGNASQPIISTNFGAGKGERILGVLRMALITDVIIGVVFTAIIELFPTQLIQLLMDATPEVLEIAPPFLRVYFISAFFLVFNVYFTYYFQAIMRTKASFAVSILRGVVISGILIFALPVMFGPESIWWAMPITEILIFVMAVLLMLKYNKDIRKLENI